MVTLSTGMIVALLIAGGITTLAMLSVFANVIGHETQLHDLRNRVKDLQFKHSMYLARINGRIPDEYAAEPILEVEEYVDEDSEPVLNESAQAQSLPAQTEQPAVAA